MLVLAQEEARLAGLGFIGTEHVLLGLLHEGEGPAARALESSRITLEAVRAKVGEMPRSAPAEPGGSPPFSARAKKALERSLREALQLGHNSIGTGHLFLGLLGDEEGVAVRVLRSLGADLDRLRADVVRRLSDGPVEPPSATRPVAIGREVPNDPPRHVGASWRVEVVRAGRGPEEAAAAYRELARLVANFGVELDALHPGEVMVESVETDHGPGLMLAVTRAGGK